MFLPYVAHCRVVAEVHCEDAQSVEPMLTDVDGSLVPNEKPEMVTVADPVGAALNPAW